VAKAASDKEFATHTNEFSAPNAYNTAMPSPPQKKFNKSGKSSHKMLKQA